MLLPDGHDLAPRWTGIPEERAGTLGDEAVALVAGMGLDLDPAQQHAVDVLSSVDTSGDWAALEHGLVLARQNGKTKGIMVALALYDLFCGPPGSLVVWTAHRTRTAHDTYGYMQDLVERCPATHKRAPGRYWRQSNGQQGVTLDNGSQLKILARTSGSGRGLSADSVYIDEAMILSPDVVGALLPTLSARKNPRIVYGASAGLSVSEHLRDVRDRGRAGKIAYVEWGADPDVFRCERGLACSHARTEVGCALDDERAWRAANPALVTGRIKRRIVVAERSGMDPVQFATERLSWWQDLDVTRQVPITGEAWQALADDQAGETAREDLSPVFAIDVTPDRTECVVTVAAALPDGRVHVGVVEAFTRFDAQTVGERLEQLSDEYGQQPIWCDPMSPAGILARDIGARYRVDFHEVTTREYGDACARLQDLVRERMITHNGNPRFTDALGVAKARALGDGVWGWGRRGSTGSIAAIVSASLSVSGRSILMAEGDDSRHEE